MATENEPTIQSLAEGQQKLADGQQELAEAHQKLAEGHQKLAEGQQQLAEGQQQLTSLLTDFIEEQRRVNASVERRLQTMQDDIDEQRKFMDEQREFNEQQRMFNRTQRSISDEIERRIRQIEDDLIEQRQFNTEQREFNQEQRIFNRAQLEFNERVERRLAAMHNDIAEVKGGHARTETLRRAEAIASALRFSYERMLSAGELQDMVRENPDRGIPANELDSFSKADLVIKAKDGDLLTNYIAVEISYTADQRDIDRAKRNAEFLTKFTGRPAHAVVASVRNDSVVSNLVSVGYVNWYSIPLRVLQTA